MKTNGWARGAPYQDVAPVNERQIYGVLLERDNARRAKDFELADSLMDELNSLGVAFLDDREKNWFASAPASPNAERMRLDASPWDPSNSQSKRKGDWSCPDCGANVFASKSECYRCGCARPAAAGARIRDGGADDIWMGGGLGLDSSRNQPGWGGTPSAGSGFRFPPFVRQRGDSAVVDEVAVADLLADREEARRMRDYDTADRIRDLLQADFGVSPHPIFYRHSSLALT